MELTVRDWIFIVASLLLLAVVFDAVRRVRQERRNRLHMSLRKTLRVGEMFEELEEMNGELPNGGARTVTGRASNSVSTATQRGKPETLPLDLEIPVPMLVDSVEQHRQDPYIDEQVALDEPEPPIPAMPDLDSEEGRVAEPLLGRAEEGFSAQDAAPQSLPESAAAERTGGSVEKVARSFKNTLFGGGRQVDTEHTEAGESAKSRAPVEEVLVVHVVAKEAPFAGIQLMNLLNACDLRYGEMHIFHRYELAKGMGAIQFSLVNMVVPGTFDLDCMDDFVTPGVSLFVSLPGPTEPLKAFDYMVETAQVIARHLHGELRDETHSAMTGQTLEHLRQRIRDYERKRLAKLSSHA